MCALFGSFHSEKLSELAKLNSNRGSHAHSLCFFDPRVGKMIWQEKSLGPFPQSEILIPKACFAIAHVQSPTKVQETSVDPKRSIHPAEYLGQYLWHNGMIKEQEIKRLQAQFGTEESWDTKLVLFALSSGTSLSTIKGSFSCFWLVEHAFYVFRNELSPLFVDSEMSFSSEPFKNSRSVSPNVLFKANWNSLQLQSINSFETKENPYYFS